MPSYEILPRMDTYISNITIDNEYQGTEGIINEISVGLIFGSVGREN